MATSSQVTQQGCYTSATLTGGSSSTITNPDTCFSTCLNWKYMSITPVGTGGTYTCTCGTAETLGTSANCAVNRPVVYTNSDGTASLAARRRRALEIAARMQAQQKVCPGSLKSCFTATPSLSEGIAFECVDTKSELESCGGCVRGEYTNDFVLGQTIATSGEDCTAIEGVAFGAVSCVKGRCVASQCSSGYRLVNGSCEPDASFKVQARATAKAN